MSLASFTIDVGISPEISLSARLNTLRLRIFPMSVGIWPVRQFPARSRSRREESDVTQAGISPEIPFQSATTREVRLLNVQISGEIVPVM